MSINRNEYGMERSVSDRNTISVEGTALGREALSVSRNKYGMESSISDLSTITVEGTAVGKKVIPVRQAVRVCFLQ